MTVEGTIKRIAIAGETWLVVTSEGRRFQLVGDAAVLAPLQVEGLRVKLEGELAKDRMSIGMTAPLFTVTRGERA